MESTETKTRKERTPKTSVKRALTDFVNKLTELEADFFMHTAKAHFELAASQESASAYEKATNGSINEKLKS